MRQFTFLFLAVVISTTLGACDSGTSGSEPGEGSGDESGGEGPGPVGESGGEGEETGEPVAEEGGGGEACASIDTHEGAPIRGWIYDDLGAPDVSMHVAGYDPAVDVAIAGMEVALLSTAGEEVTVTCDDGGFAFEDAGFGARIVAPAFETGTICNSRNCPHRLIEAIREGGVKIVTFGDSVPVIGSSVTFPAHLGERINAFAPTTSVNVAVGGTTSPQWLPGTNLFETKLLPEVAGADVVIASIGGNDLLEYANNALSGAGGLTGAIEGAALKVQEIMANVLLTFTEIRKSNPDVDLIYCLYPNYAESAIWGDMLNVFPGVQGMVVGLIADALDQVRAEIDPNADIVLVDFFAAMDAPLLDDLLYDQLHFNDAGHVFYADEIFRTLGGVVLGPTTQAEISFGVHVSP